MASVTRNHHGRRCHTLTSMHSPASSCTMHSPASSSCPGEGEGEADNPTQDQVCARIINEIWEGREAIPSMKKRDKKFKEQADQNLATVTSVYCFDNIDQLLTHLKNKKGTTNVIYVLDMNNILIGLDTRVSSKEAGIENIHKYEFITTKKPYIVATMCGNVGACEDTWEHMLEHVRELQRIGVVPNVSTVSDDASKMHRDPPPKDDKEIPEDGKEIPEDDKEILIGHFVCGFEGNVARVHSITDGFMANGERCNREERMTDDFSDDGSGGPIAHKKWLLLKDKWAGSQPSLEDAVQYLNQALLEAALKDEDSGGMLTVLHMTPNSSPTVKSYESVIRLYHTYYQNYSHLEDRSVFVFYRPKEIKIEELQTKLKKAGKLEDIGHPLTHLKDRYHIQRVVYEKAEYVSTLWAQSKVKIHERQYPIFSHSNDFKLQMLVNGKMKMYVARHSREILESLIVDEDSIFLGGNYHLTCI